MADGLLVKVRRGGLGGRFAAVDALGASEPLLELPPGHSAPDMGLAPDEGTAWVRIAVSENPWDRAHSLLSPGFGAAAAGVIAVEPDFDQQWAEDSGGKAQCVAAAQSDGGGRAKGPEDGWHLDDAHSGLRSARERVEREASGRLGEVRVAHLDTGYDPRHRARPQTILGDQARDFTGGRAQPGAEDETPPGLPYQRGHGTGTLGLLAGGEPGGLTFPGPIGGAPGAAILPIRVANSVVRFTTGGIVRGFDWAIRNDAHIISMSMGGLASEALADAVNLAYERGIVVVTAAGNWFGAREAVSTPATIVYPARMRRVLAATGVMADGRAYAGLKFGTMQGCYGPASKMATAIAGWTPNVPWAELGCGAVIDMDGGGTSAATPQVAAAAALWIALHWDAYRAQAGWRRAELVRQALLQSARRTTAAMDADEVREKLGAGALDAVRALATMPDVQALQPAPRASARWAWLRLLSGEGVGVAEAASAPRARLLELEVLHAAQLDPELLREVGDPEAGDPGEGRRKAFFERLEAAPGLSQTLQNVIQAVLKKRGLGPVIMPPAPNAPQPHGRAASPLRPPAPERRRLRIFALDPSLGAALETVDANIATVDVPFETGADGRESILRPGPVGEYVEVVDVDPASDRFYPPVDLDDPHLLLTDGLSPSEGKPQFHQQMVYAVAMRTIESFERALGRPAIWAPRRRPGPDHAYDYVQRLRIYPHALRAKNAYYSPDKVALLFGYFPSEADRNARTPGGTLVFSALSADIIAHEMCHALLDGYTRGYRENSNPDVGAFHEAFADIVALLQHFQIKDLVRRGIAAARTDLGAAGLLGGLAKQFGEGARLGGPLRDYVEGVKPPDYRTSFEVHDRGSLLVRAVYLAFVAIYERRTGDLIRLATGGTGILGQGAIHPDLVERLTDEACEAAGHVLRMSVRALDFTPHVDVTFGDYLRGLITADLEQVERDDYRYRTAFLESFRKLDLLPDGLRTVSTDTLKWPGFTERVRSRRLVDRLRADGWPRADESDLASPPWLKPLVETLGIPWRDSVERSVIWEAIERRGWQVHAGLTELFDQNPAWCEALGLALGNPKYAKDGTEVPATGHATTFEVRTVRGAQRPRPDGRIKEHIIIGIHQRRAAPLDGRDLANGMFWFRGVSLLVIEPAASRGKAPKLLYVMNRDVSDRDREARERAWRTGAGGQSARGMYFGAGTGGGFDGSRREPFAELHAEEA